ncbi:MAG: VOC family protein [Nocardioidaceae bacterium]|jgi:predicted enzyme related to lactoylglutathione lyase|nr:VOC family protein [Nocardioidaceae bacterium]
MITAVAFTTVNVADQQRAKEFYTDTLGFELLRDVPMGPPDGPRWIEVVPPGARTRLILFHAPDQIGPMAQFVLSTDDLVETCKELERRGVEVLEQPAVAEWGGWWASIQDSEGNVVGLGQEDDDE